MDTKPLFRDDAYMKSCEANVLGVNDRGGIILDRTVFYATGGGQPGDTGALTTEASALPIATAVKGETPGEIVHVPAEPGNLPDPGSTVEAALDWERRYRHMRIHTCLHLLSVALPFPVTGGQINADYGRLDFDLSEPVDKDEITEKLNALVSGDHAVSSEWITDEELADNPDLVKTMAVKPPMGTGRVRLVRIGEIDLQPCGGTHVNSAAEIGPVTVTKVEKKGARNRRVRVAFQEGT